MRKKLNLDDVIALAEEAGENLDMTPNEVEKALCLVGAAHEAFLIEALKEAHRLLQH
jgi:hypothetical protein